MRWDVVVVGAGSAGCVIAARASEDPSTSVLLLESGPDASTDDEDARSSPSFWRALAVPGRLWDDLAAVPVDGQAPRPYTRGHGVGGSGEVNAMLALPALPEDHERWVRAGAASWSWEEVAPWYERVLAGPGSYETVPTSERGDVDRAFRDAALACGLPAEDAVLAARRGRRVSTAGAYLGPARTRPNLRVRAGAPAERVVLHGDHAVGVLLATGELVEAGRVVVCAGAVHSPLLLQRSGLTDPGIGAGLKDHPAFTLRLPLDQAQRATSDDHRPVASVVRWSTGTEPADIQLLAFQSAGVGEEGRASALLMVALMDVRSEGVVRLVDGRPSVELGMLRDPVDLARLRAGVRVAARVAEAMPALGAEPVAADGTTLSTILAMDDDAVDALLRRTAGDYVHASSSCRMGTGPGAVVDEWCDVHGIEGLSVVDASVFPDIPRANTHLPVVVLAERVAARWRER